MYEFLTLLFFGLFMFLPLVHLFIVVTSRSLKTLSLSAIEVLPLSGTLK